MRIIVIEDEQPALKRITKLVQDIDTSIHIVATADSIESAVHAFEQQSDIDLALMDIELADGQSFDIFKRTKVSCPVIFTTAYDEFAIKAFKVNSIDYLLKPIDKNELAASLNKFKQLHHTPAHEQTQFESLIKQFLPEKATYKNRFLIKHGTKLISVSAEQIAYFYAHEKIVYVHTSDAHRYVVDYTLDELEQVLKPTQFFRINRQILAHIQSIRTVNTYFNGKLKADLIPKTESEVIISRERASDFKKWMGQ